MKLPLLHFKTAVVGIATAAIALALTTNTAAQTSNNMPMQVFGLANAPGKSKVLVSLKQPEDYTA